MCPPVPKPQPLRVEGSKLLFWVAELFVSLVAYGFSPEVVSSVMVTPPRNIT